MALRGALTHRKTRRLARLLGYQVPCALGIMEALWHVTASHAPTGAIGRLTNQDIADEMFWDGNADELIWHLVTAELLDEDPEHRLIVHGWEEHADQSVRRKLARNGQAIACQAQPQPASDEPRLAMTSHDETHAGPKPEPVPEPEPEPVPEPGTPNMADLQPAPALEVEQASEPETEPPEPERPPPKAEPWQPLWESFLALYPRRSGDRGVKAGREVFGRLLKAGKAEAEALLRGVRAYRAWADDTGKTGTELVKQIPTWLHGECWQEDWSGRPPARASPNGSAKREESLAEQRDRLLATIRTGREGDLFGVKGGGDADG